MSSHLRRGALLLLLLIPSLALAQYALLKAGSTPLDPEREARVEALSKKLRCPLCQGMSIWDSTSAPAVAQVDTVRRLVSEGKSDEEVRAYFIARYGEWILLQPKAEGFNLVVWLAPGVLLLLGFAVIAAQLRKGKAAPPEPTQLAAAAPAPAAAAPSEELAEYLGRVRKEMDS